MIDNYDSFTYNLVQYFNILGQDVEVVKNDEIKPEDIKYMDIDAIRNTLQGLALQKRLVYL